MGKLPLGSEGQHTETPGQRERLLAAIQDILGDDYNFYAAGDGMDRTTAQTVVSQLAEQGIINPGTEIHMTDHLPNINPIDLATQLLPHLKNRDE